MAGSVPVHRLALGLRFARCDPALRPWGTEQSAARNREDRVGLSKQSCSVCLPSLRRISMLERRRAMSLIIIGTVLALIIAYLTNVIAADPPPLVKTYALPILIVL